MALISVCAENWAGPVDERLEKIVELMFERCFKDKQFKQALGIALESRRLDKVTEAIKLSDNVSEMLAYCYHVCTSLVTSRDWRRTVLTSQCCHF